MLKYINQVKEFTTLDDLNFFLSSIKSEEVIRIISHKNGYLLIYKTETY